MGKKVLLNQSHVYIFWHPCQKAIGNVVDEGTEQGWQQSIQCSIFDEPLSVHREMMNAPELIANSSGKLGRSHQVKKPQKIIPSNELSLLLVDGLVYLWRIKSLPKSCEVHYHCHHLYAVQKTTTTGEPLPNTNCGNCSFNAGISRMYSPEWSNNQVPWPSATFEVGNIQMILSG